VATAPAPSGEIAIRDAAVGAYRRRRDAVLRATWPPWGRRAGFRGTWRLGAGFRGAGGGRRTGAWIGIGTGRSFIGADLRAFGSMVGWAMMDGVASRKCRTANPQTLHRL